MENYRFQLLSAKGDIKNQRVILKFSSDVDEETATADNIYLMNRTAKAVVPVNIVVNRCFVYLELLKWAVPKEEYSLVIGSGLQNIVEESFEATPPVVFTFESKITSDVKILYPVNHMDLTEVALKWKEINSDKDAEYVGSFYIEIALENAFYNIVYKTTVDKSTEISADNIYSVILTELTEDKQYYVRIRAEKDGEYGAWSDTITFSKNKDTQQSIPEVSEDAEGPTIIDYTKPVAQTTVIEKTPVMKYSGELIYDDELPTSFEFTSTAELDISNVQVSVKRKVI